MVPGCLGDMRELAPTAMAGVPLVFDRIRAGIIKKIQKESTLKQIIFKVALSIKQWAYVRGRATPLLDKVVFNQFKTGLGGNMRFMVSGGAPLSRSCHLFLQACFGVPLLQGYGLTETCGAGNVMMMDDRTQGTVGPPVPCVEVKLIDAPEMGYFAKNNTGEVWIRGPAITRGYFLNDELT
jgi:long-chain acyl-CoA synthetase